LVGRGHVESPFFQQVNRLIVLIYLQVISQQLVEITVQPTLGHHAAVLHFEGA